MNNNENINRNARNQDRNLGYARVILLPHNLLGYIRDLSSNGCRIDFLENTGLVEDEVYRARIFQTLDDQEIKILLNLRCRWIKSGMIYTSSGFEIMAISGEHDKLSFEKLISYYQKP